MRDLQPSAPLLSPIPNHSGAGDGESVQQEGPRSSLYENQMDGTDISYICPPHFNGHPLFKRSGQHQQPENLIVKEECNGKGSQMEKGDSLQQQSSWQPDSAAGKQQQRSWQPDNIAVQPQESYWPLPETQQDNVNWEEEIIEQICRMSKATSQQQQQNSWQPEPQHDHVDWQENIIGQLRELSKTGSKPSSWQPVDYASPHWERVEEDGEVVVSAAKQQQWSGPERPPLQNYLSEQDLAWEKAEMSGSGNMEALAAGERRRSSWQEQPQKENVHPHVNVMNHEWSSLPEPEVPSYSMVAGGKGETGAMAKTSADDAAVLDEEDLWFR